MQTRCHCQFDAVPIIPHRYAPSVRQNARAVFSVDSRPSFHKMPPFCSIRQWRPSRYYDSCCCRILEIQCVWLGMRLKEHRVGCSEQAGRLDRTDLNVCICELEIQRKRIVLTLKGKEEANADADMRSTWQDFGSGQRNVSTLRCRKRKNR